MYVWYFVNTKNYLFLFFSVTLCYVYKYVFISVLTLFNICIYNKYDWTISFNLKWHIKVKEREKYILYIYIVCFVSSTNHFCIQ
jgi:hypothetical protein